MNWDISLGHVKQSYGRLLQSIGARFGHRRMVLNGERIEYHGRLQVRYGAIKHQAQWNWHSMEIRPQPIRTTNRSVP